MIYFLGCIQSWIVLPLLFLSIQLCAQDLANDYEPIGGQVFSYQDYDQIKDQFSNFSSAVEIDNRCARNKFSDITDESWNEYKLSSSDYSLLTENNLITDFIDKVLKVITENNPELKGKEYKVLISRSSQVNASARGINTIFIHLGLLERMTNVDQLAFVICHELSHDYLFHSWTTRKENALLLCDKSLQKDIKDAQKLIYDRNRTLSNILKNQLAHGRYYNRERELQADSLGFVFMKKSGFNTRGSLEVMDILKKSEQPFITFPDTLNLKSHFDFKEYPFKDSWYSKSNLSTKWIIAGKFYEIPDELRSHPDAAIRKGILEGFDQVTLSNESLDEEFRTIKSIIPFELLAALIDQQNYGVALFRSLNLLQKYPDNKYLHCITGWCLYHLHGALKRNQYSFYVNFPSENFSIGYNYYLSFLHNLNSTNFKNIFNHYYELNIENSIDHNYGPFLKYLHSNMNSSEKYPNGGTENFINTQTQYPIIDYINNNK